MEACPVTVSWPSARPAAAALQEQQQHDAETAEQPASLSPEQLQAWQKCLSCDEDGFLVISADSLHMLPAQMPCDVLGACMLAAVDSLAAVAAAAAAVNSLAAVAAAAAAASPSQQQQQLGLRFYSVDLQEPLAAPLSTCFSGAFPFLQHLSLQELNVDSQAAAALGSLTAGTSSSSSILSLSLQSVFMCEMAWQALAKGIRAGCGLHTLRLKDCAGLPSELAAAVAAGCNSLQRLDLSGSTLAAAAPATTSSSGHSAAAGDCADQAWAALIDAFSQPCCPGLQALTLNKCALGPQAGAALVKLLKAKGRANLQQLVLAECAGMGEATLRQLAAAAGSHPALRVLDLSCTACTDSCAKALLGHGSWLWQQRPCQQLRELRLAGNSLLTAAAVEELAKAVVTGRLPLHTLDLANCPATGDAGAVALASCLAACCCRIQSLNLSGCEVTDTGAAALAGAVANSSTASRQGQASGCQLQQLRLADNQITAAGIMCWSEAIQNPSGCALQLLDVSGNWCGPEAVRPLAIAAAAAAAAAVLRAAPGTNQQQQQQAAGDSSPQPSSKPPIKVLCECSHDMWRVEAAKAAARAVAAADAAAVAAAEAAAAAAAAGSSWDPHGSDQLSVQQHPAAATALGFTNSTYNEGCGGSSLRTHAGSPVAPFSPLSCRKRPVQTGSAVWLYNGLFCDPGQAWSPDSSPPDAAQAQASAAAVKPGSTASLTSPAVGGHPVATQLVFADACASDTEGSCAAASGGDDNGTDDAAGTDSSRHGSERSCSGSSGSGSPAETGGFVPGAAAAATAVAVGTSGAGATGAAAAAASGADDAPDTASCDGTVCTSSSSGGSDDGCIQQEVSFKCQLPVPADDAVHSPTRYDQQQHDQQQQQLKGLLGWQEFTLSPPNPLFFSSSPLASPIAPRKLAVDLQGAQPVQLRLRVRPEAASSTADTAATAAAGTAVAAAQQRTTGLQEQGGSKQPLPPTHAVQPPPAAACGAGVRAVMQLRTPFSPDRQLAAPTARALPPGSPRRRCALNTPPAAPLAGFAIGAAGVGAPAGAAALPTACEGSPQHHKLEPHNSAAPGSAGSSSGSSGSPLALPSPSKAARQRVTQPDRQQPLRPLQQMAVSGVLEGVEGAQPLSQLQQPARQLFSELPEGCEVMAVASSRSYWDGLCAGLEPEGQDAAGGGGDGQAWRQAHALPLVGE